MTQKKTPNPASKRGKAAVQKGIAFETKVASLYTLLGAKVTQNILVCGKKVDLLAVFRLPGSTIEHRVIVECKNESKAVAQNQRVMAFKGLLDLARKQGEADSAEIITQVDWSDAAKSFARGAGIEVLTYTQKTMQLMDFRDYLNGLIAKFDNIDPARSAEPAMSACFVDLIAEHIVADKKQKVDLLSKHLLAWSNSMSQTRHVAILGDYGSGKSTLCHKLARDLSESYLREPKSSRIPILISLRHFTKRVTIDAQVTSFLDEECGIANPKFRLFQEMNESGAFLLIFDGLDEMAVKVDRDVLESNLQELEKLATPERAMAILTCRPEYFVTNEEETVAFRPKVELLATRVSDYHTMKVLPWGDEQIKSFLKKRVRGKANGSMDFYWEKIRNIPGLSDLSRRPVLLEMIVKTLPDLLEGGGPINRPSLYNAYLSNELRRQVVLKKRQLLFKTETRFALLEQLALEIYVGTMPDVTFTTTVDYLSSKMSVPADEREAYARDFLACSFLIRESAKYKFSHKSIMEYLVARRMHREIEESAPNGLAKNGIEPVVAGFLIELGVKKSVLSKWIEAARTPRATHSAACLAGNAATLLLMLDRNAFSNADMSNACMVEPDFRHASLEGASFDGAVLMDVDLTMARFSRRTFSGATIAPAFVNILVHLAEGGASWLADNLSALRRKAAAKSKIVECHVGRAFATVSLMCNELKDADRLAAALRANPLTKGVALYADEHVALMSGLSPGERRSFNTEWLYLQLRESSLHLGSVVSRRQSRARKSRPTQQ